MKRLTPILRVICLLTVALNLSSLGALAQESSRVKRIRNYFEGRERYETPPSSNDANARRIKVRYRTYDGTENNIDFPDYGAANMPLLRLLTPEYGTSNFLNAIGGQNRDSPRAISNIVANQTQDMPSASMLSTMVYTWGQFLDHDIDLTPESEEVAIIPLPPDEPLFTAPIVFHRSQAVPGTGVVNFRQQPNIITSWIDGSVVYGSDEDRANWLRTFQGGKLKTSAGGLLPYNTITGEFADPIDPNAPGMAGAGPGVKLFVAGDVRANEQAGLTSMHALFVREHNRICDMFLARGWTDDEDIYQKARSLVGGYIQSITFNEFLPALGISLNLYSGYNPAIQPDVANIFSTAAYRIGHTMVADQLLLMDDQGQPIGPGVLPLLAAFFNPSTVATYSIEPILFGLAHQTQQEIDNKVVDALRNFLFISPGATFGLDLPSLNIQRGRDHGLPDYNTVRAFYLGSPATSFADISSDPVVQQNLQTAYNNDIDEIDAWVGMLAEDHIAGAEVGATMFAVLRDQFIRLRDGDFFYYEIDPNLTEEERVEVSNTVLSDVLNRNTPFYFKREVFYNRPGDEPWLRQSTQAQTVAAGGSNNASIYPNPSNGSFMVAGEMEPSLLQIYNFSGALVYEKEFFGKTYRDQWVDMGQVKPGVYVLQITDVQGGIEQIRFMIEQ